MCVGCCLYNITNRGVVPHCLLIILDIQYLWNGIIQHQSGLLSRSQGASKYGNIAKINMSDVCIYQLITEMFVLLLLSVSR